MKHNKKRNVGLIYELFLKHMSDCLVEGRISDLKKATKIIEKRFAKNTELYREFRLFNALAKTTVTNTHIVASILTEAKSAARNYDIKKLNSEKSRLIHDINHKINDPKFYYRNISNYRDLATIQLTINEWRKGDNCDIQKLVEYEKKIVDSLLKEKKNTNIDEELKKLKASDSNKLILKIMTEKINQKYGSDLSEDSKEIIKKYAIYSTGDHKILKEFLNKKKNQALIILEKFKVKEDNSFLLKKVDNVKNKINELKIDKIDDQTVVKFLTLTSLIKEIKSEEK